jgi:phage I-like protein
VRRSKAGSQTASRNKGAPNLSNEALVRTVEAVKGKHQPTIKFALGALLDSIVLGSDGKAPTEFRIFGAGVNTSSKGDFIFDDEAARSVMGNFAKKASALTMDYEHQAAAYPPVKAPASAYSWRPEVRATAAGPELWAADVKWTDEARRMIEAREYNYFSPLFEAASDTGRVLNVINLALTNTPALDGLAPLIAAAALAGADRTRTGKDTSMKKLSCSKCTKALRAPTDDDEGDEVMCTACSGAVSTAVGLRADARHAEQLSAIGGLVALRGEVLKITGQESPEKAVAALSAMKDKAERCDAAEKELSGIKLAALTARLDAVFDGAIKEGKLEPAKRQELQASLLALSGGVITEAVVNAASVHVSMLAAKVTVAASGAGAGALARINLPPAPFC